MDTEAVCVALTKDVARATPVFDSISASCSSRRVGSSGNMANKAALGSRSAATRHESMR